MPGSSTHRGWWWDKENERLLVVFNGTTVAGYDSTGGVLDVVGSLTPSTSDGGALGTTALMWSDLFLASGGVINFNNGDVLFTHVSNGVQVSGGDITIATGFGITVGSTSQSVISDGDGSTNVTPEAQVVGVNATGGGILLIAEYNATNTRAASPKLALLKGGAATQVSTAEVEDSEVVGSIIAYGTDGTDAESPVASIEAVINGTVGTGDMPGSWEISTTADGGESLTIAVVIDTNQDVHLQTDSANTLYFGAGDDASFGHDGTSFILNFPQTTDEFVINESGADTNFRVEGDTDTNMIAVEAGVDAIGFGIGGQAFGFMALQGGNATRAAVAGRGAVLDIVADTQNWSNGSGTISVGAAIVVGTQTWTGDSATLTFTGGASVYIAGPPVASTHVAITTAYSLWVEAGSVRLDGSLWVEGTPTEGSSGEQLTSGGAATVMTWAAAGSLPAYKEIHGELAPEEALKAILGTRVPTWNYRTHTADGERSVTTQDYETEYAGVMADEFPEVMHHEGRIFSPVSAFGYTVAAFNGMQKEIDELRALLPKGSSAK